MAEVTHSGDIPDRVIGQRFELVDPQGRVRAVVGDASGEADEWIPGLSLLDEEGRLRATLLVCRGGAVLSFIAEGNVVAELGVGDSPAAFEPGPYVVLCDANGATAWRANVDRDGQVYITQPGRSCP